MKCCRWIYILIINVLILVFSDSTLAANALLNPGDGGLFGAHTGPVEAFTNIGSFNLDEVAALSAVISDSAMTSSLDHINVTSFIILEDSGALVSAFRDLSSYIFSLGSLENGDYTVALEGYSSACAGSEDDVKVNNVPLPAASWLLGTAIVGFAAFSARRSV